MFQKKMLIISTSIAVALTVAGQANADVTIIHDADGGTEVQAGKVRVSTGDGGTQIQTSGSSRSLERLELTARGNSRRYKNRRFIKPPVGNIQVKIPEIQVKPIRVPTIINGPTVIRSTGSQGSIYSSQTSRSSNGNSSNSQTTVIHGDGHSHTNSNHDSD